MGMNSSSLYVDFQPKSLGFIWGWRPPVPESAYISSTEWTLIRFCDYDSTINTGMDIIIYYYYYN